MEKSKWVILTLFVITTLMLVAACGTAPAATDQLPAPLYDSGSIASDQLAQSYKANGAVIWGCDSVWKKCGVLLGGNVLSTYASGMTQTEGELVQTNNFYRTKPPTHVQYSDVWAIQYQSDSPTIMGMSPMQTVLSIGLAGVITVVAWKNIGGKSGEARELSAAEQAAMAREASNAMRVSDDMLQLAMKDISKFGDYTGKWREAGLISAQQETDMLHVMKDGGNTDAVFNELKKIVRVSDVPSAAALNMAKVGASGAAKKPGLWIFELTEYGRLTPGEIREFGDGALEFGYVKYPDSFSLTKNFRIGFGPFVLNRSSTETGQFGGYMLFRREGLNELQEIAKTSRATLDAVKALEESLGGKLDALAAAQKTTRTELLEKMDVAIAQGATTRDLIQQYGDAGLKQNRELMDALSELERPNITINNSANATSSSAVDLDQLLINALDGEETTNQYVTRVVKAVPQAQRDEVATIIRSKRALADSQRTLADGQVTRSKLLDEGRSAVQNGFGDPRFPAEIKITAGAGDGESLGSALLKKKKPVFAPVYVDSAKYIGGF